jgi:Zn-dependent protease
MSPDFYFAARQGLTLYIILVVSIGLHEFGHAKAADLLGDGLPRLQGRVTLNPLAHIDMIGTVLIPLFMIFLPIFAGSPMPVSLIGWGKPVQISLPYPATRVRDDILCTLAGPLMNLVILVVVTAVSAAVFHFQGELNYAFATIVVVTIQLNTILIVFNLIPIPPLDGSRIFRRLVGMREETFAQLAANGWWILLVLINIPAFRTFLSQARNVVPPPSSPADGHLPFNLLTL